MRALAARLRRLLRATDGVAAIEFALVAPLFVIFCVSIFEGGRMMWIRNSIQTATEEAGRWAMVNTAATDPQIQTIAVNYYGSVGSDTPTFAIKRDTVSTMNYVTISGSYTFKFTFPFFDFAPITLAGKARVPLLS